MKKLLVIYRHKILCLCLLSLIPVVSVAQFNTYHPFPDSNAEWNETAGNASCGTGDDIRSYVYVIDGDTIFNGLTYHKIYQIWGYWYNSCSTPFQIWLYSRIFYGAYRADTMKHIYACCTQYLGSHDSLLYDFNLKTGDTLTQYTAHAGWLPGPCTVHSIDSVLVGTNYRERLNIAINGDTNITPPFSIVEGIGCTQGLFDFFFIPFEISTSLDCFTQNDTTWKPPYSNQSAYCGLYVESVNDLNKPKNAITVSPNPSSDKFSFQLSEVCRQLSVEVYNVLGERIETQCIASLQTPSAFTIDLSDQPNGVYFYRLIAQNGELIGEGKLIIQK